MPQFGTPLLTVSGRALVIGRLAGSGSNPGYLAWGTGTTPPTTADSQLAAEVGVRAAATVTAVVGPRSGLANGAVQYQGTLSASAGWTIGEVGLFLASTGGAPLVRGLLVTPTAFNTGDTLTLAVTLEFV